MIVCLGNMHGNCLKRKLGIFYYFLKSFYIVNAKWFLVILITTSPASEITFLLLTHSSCRVNTISVSVWQIWLFRQNPGYYFVHYFCILYNGQALLCSFLSKIFLFPGIYILTLHAGLSIIITRFIFRQCGIKSFYFFSFMR